MTDHTTLPGRSSHGTVRLADLLQPEPEPTPAPTPATAIRDVVGAIHTACERLEASGGDTRADEARRILLRALLDVGAARLIVDPDAGR